MSTAASASPARRRAVYVGRLAVFALAVVGALAGIGVFLTHAVGDPLADVRAYYDAGARLNAGLPLYPADQDVNAPTAYFYPPLFAILFRPLAALPYDVAAAIWTGIVVAAFVATLWLAGIRRPATWIAVGILGMPIGWALAIAQAESVVTLLLTIGSPFGIALAANIKLFPLLAGVWFLGRRDWHRLALLAGWTAALGLVQLVLEPQATRDFLQAVRPQWVGEVRNLSPYAISPVLWAVLLGGGVFLAWRLAPTRWGWAAAVALSVLATPRLLLYVFMTLLAALRQPAGAAAATSDARAPADALRLDSAR
ncbi:MAG TPA: glycosyltransferase 87 family protein [Patescibacteria group bacterium]|nr:glycosyltransferase 87 family protein [Patescibacteria group bacterium]